MRWQVEWGKELSFLQEVERTTGVTPPSLAARPLIRPSSVTHLNAFYELCAGRPVGEVVGPLSTADILAYCTLTGIRGGTERLRFFEIIRGLDIVYCAAINEKRAKA